MSGLDFDIRAMDTSQPGSEELLLKLSRHEEVLTRSNAVEMLWDFVSEPVIERMEELLSDEEEDDLVVVEALEWVATNEMKRFHKEVVALLDDPSQLLQTYAAHALLEIGSKQDIAMLESKLANAPDEIKSSLLFALANLSEPERFAGDIFAFLQHDGWIARMRTIAITDRLAEMIDPQRVVNALQRALLAETQKGNRHAIEKKLKEIGEQAERDD